MKKIWNAFHEVVRTIGFSCYVVILFCNIFQVVLRFFFGKNTSWCEEVSQMCYISACFLGICFVERENGHIRLDMIFNYIPKAQVFLEDIGRLLCAVYSGMIAYSVYTLWPAIVATKTKASGIPLRYIYGIIAFGAILWAIDALINFVESFFLSKNKKKEA